MTEGEFFLAMDKMAGLYGGGQEVLRTTVPYEAKAHGLDFDLDGPYDEQAVITEPLFVFLSGVSAGSNPLYQVATARLSWEAYQMYLRRKDIRLLVFAERQHKNRA